MLVMVDMQTHQVQTHLETQQLPILGVVEGVRNFPHKQLELLVEQVVLELLLLNIKCQQKLDWCSLQLEHGFAQNRLHLSIILSSVAVAVVVPEDLEVEMAPAAVAVDLELVLWP
jgi:hypothetical protein